MKKSRTQIKLFTYLILAMIIIPVFGGNIFSQEKQKPGTRQPVALKKQAGNFSNTPEIDYSQREKEILEQMQSLKKTDGDESNGDKILELQKQLESSNGSTVTRQETNPVGTLIPASKLNNQQTDNLSPTYIIAFAGGYVAGLAAQVEQRGTTAGKIWVAVALANADTNIFGPADTIALYYSVNNGVSYDLYAKIAFSSYNRNDFGNIDMEIIENTTGTKYIYLVFGYTTLGGSGQKLIGYTIVTAPTLSYFGSTFFPPGYNSTHRYLNARVTSDNARYPGVPYVTVVITQDSIANNESHILSKVVRILSPYNLNPALSYLPKSIYGTAEGAFDDYVSTDVANYHNGVDSLIFVLSKYPGYMDKIYLYKAYSNSVVYPTFNGVLTPTGDNLEMARVASTAGTDQTQMLITYTDDYLNTGDLDQWVLYSYDASNWASNVLDYTSYNNSRFGDVIGRRNASGSYSVAFKNIYGGLENVSAYGFTDFALSSSLHSLNTNYANSLAFPKPVFRYVDSDSCLNIWSYYYSVSSTSGCSVTNLYMTAAVEGYYDDVNDVSTRQLGFYVYLANENSPYNIVDTGYAELDAPRMSNVFAFSKALTGNYYLVAKHFNAIETWSGAPVYVDPVTPSFYNFTSSDAQAYGNNMMLKGTRWCFYSGDVDQDGSIDGTDLQIIDNDAYNFITGQILFSDLNGDFIVDGSDYILADNNAFNFVNAVIP